MMRSYEKPPIYEACVKAFGIDWDNGVIFTYGDTIHCKYRVGKQKVSHERVHIKQQAKYGVEAWWARYLIDPDFRLSQEIEAYRAELDWINTNIKGIVERGARLQGIIIDLSSSMYGNIVTREEALNLLTAK